MLTLCFLLFRWPRGPGETRLSSTAQRVVNDLRTTANILNRNSRIVDDKSTATWNLKKSPTCVCFMARTFGCCLPDFTRGEGGIEWGGDTSRYYTKPWQNIQSPTKLYKDITYSTKPQMFDKTENIKQEQQLTSFEICSSISNLKNDMW